MTDRARQREELANVKGLLLGRIDSLVQELVPHGHRAGPYWMCRNPTRDDRHLGSMWVRMSGTGIGVWADEATGDGAAQSPNGQHKADVFGLIGYVKGLAFADVVKWARDFTGIEQLDDEKIRTARAALVHRADDAKREAAELESKRRGALAWWLKGQQKLQQTPVATYLRGRGVDLAQLAALPRALRFMPLQKHKESGLQRPAILSLMTGPDPAGKAESVLYAVHCTLLEADGSGKADLGLAADGEPHNSRFMWPTFKGGSIRLARGETGLSPGDAAKQGLLDTLCLCEGIEDGLSIALACPELRVWAAGTVGNLRSIVLPECCAEVIVAADNDWGKPQAQKLLDAGVAALRAQGRPVRIARSAIGKDANDALVSGGLRMPVVPEARASSATASGRVDAAATERGA